MVVFNLTKPGNILGALLGDPDIGTRINSQVGGRGGWPLALSPVFLGSFLQVLGV